MTIKSLDLPPSKEALCCLQEIEAILDRISYPNIGVDDECAISVEWLELDATLIINSDGKVTLFINDDEIMLERSEWTTKLVQFLNS